MCSNCRDYEGPYDDDDEARPASHFECLLTRDHHFDEMDLYDEWTGNPLPTQLDARCIHCGTTMRESLRAIVQEIHDEIKGNIQ